MTNRHTLFPGTVPNPVRVPRYRPSIRVQAARALRVVARLTLATTTAAALCATGYALGVHVERDRLAAAELQGSHVAVSRGHIALARAALDAAAESLEDIPGAQRAVQALLDAAQIIGMMDCHTDTECEQADRLTAPAAAPNVKTL